MTAGDWRARGYLLGASLLAILAFSEVVVRLRYPALNTYRDFDPGIYAEDAERRWANLPGYRGIYQSFFEDQIVSTNSLGFRGPELRADAAASEHRVLCLGDSNTFGRGVGEEETYPAQLEAELGKRGASATVWNSGVCGYDTEQELATLRKFGPALRPTVVTLGWLGNDLGPVAPTTRVVDGYLVEREADVALVKERLQGSSWEQSYLARLLSIAVKIRRARARFSEQDVAGPMAFTAAVERNLALVREVRRASAELGARLIVIVYVDQMEVVLGRRSDLVAQVESALRSEGIEVVSSYDLFKADLDARGRDLYVVRDRGHPNGEGHALTARAVADLIARH
jgi:lysophospholipase L1-like esterase